MSYTQNTLAVVNNLPYGTLKCYLYIDDSISPALTIPTAVNITSISPIREAVDIRAGEVDLDTVTIEIADDYSTYTDGFWWTLIEENPTYNIQVMFLLTESGTDSYLFRGSIFRENVTWTEHYIDATETTFVRSASIQFVSPILMLKNISITTMVNYLVNAVVGNAAYLVEGIEDNLTENVKCVTLGNVINNMMELAFANTDEGYQVVVRGTDIKFYDGNTASYKDPTDLYLIVQVFGTEYTNAYLFDDSSEPLSWISRYDNCWELLTNICLSLGFVVRYYFGDTTGVYTGTASDKHTIEILCRGDKTTDLLTNTKRISSQATSDSPNKYLDIITRNLAGVDDQLYAVVNGIYSATDPENTSYDMEISQEFTSDQTESVLRLFEYTYVDGEGDRHFTECIKGEYYDHTNDTMQLKSYSDATNALLEMLTKYLYLRFSDGRREYNRTYGTIAFTKDGTTTHQHLKILARHEINSENYYSVDVQKDLMTNQATVKWIQE